eukprot:12918339-Prorocentrum_lima.AAC.1
MGTYGDRNVPDPRNSGIRAGNQPQQQHVEGFMYEAHDPHAHHHGRHECHSDEAMDGEGTNTSRGK